ncbi:MAG: beta-galactosidase GalA [Ginsengibacter sp.]
MNKFFFFFIVTVITNYNIAFSQNEKVTSLREHLLMDYGWRFAYGHAYDTKKDFDNGSGYFSYFAKASYGDGAAATNFDDRAWRKLDLPHDWAVEQPFDSTASFSHGFKAIGRNFPDASIGWYRKTFTIPASDSGKHISIAFDGVFRNSIVWVNGFYLGTEPSGYLGFAYNISDYLNYGGENIIAVRADATTEEGWFYEGAGIYRHVWLNKTLPLHVAANGTFVSSKLNNNIADITAQVTLINENKTSNTADIIQTIVDANGKTIASCNVKNVIVKSFEEKDFSCTIHVTSPNLWSIEKPYLYKLVTTVVDDKKIIDRYETSFGIRTIRFDANEGFFLNGKHIKIHGTNNHQDHAGVGAAMPDALIDFRIATLKSFGCNGYRCSHNPPTPELLDACDRLGMLVIDENRLMGITSTHLNDVKRLILRDRNHPSVISWSICNEEWGIEGNELGARIASTMQAFVKSLDSTRAITAAISGGWRKGISNVIDVMGANYIAQINTDEQHAKFPNQPIWGTEEGSTKATRGVYFDDRQHNMIAAYDRKANEEFFSIEEGWKHYAARNYLSGMFIWTGFDYRGEPTPFGFPSIGSYTGMMDQCGFPKDNVYYLRSWWTSQPTLHILPHWNWKGKEGRDIDVWAYSNCDEVELFLNKKSLGKKVMQLNGHLEWKVKYIPGTLVAVGYKNGKNIITDKVQTTGEPVSIALNANQTNIKADKEDIAIISVELKDKNNLHVPTANNEITFKLKGPGKIIGVGNGNPISLEADKYLETIQSIPIENMKEKIVSTFDNPAEISFDYDDSKWNNAFKDDRTQEFGELAKVIIYRSNFNLPDTISEAEINLFYKPIGKDQSIYINGTLIGKNIKESGSNTAFKIDKSILHAGKNAIAIIAVPLLKKSKWDVVNMRPGLFQIITPALVWKRKLFNGLAQIIIQSNDEPGEIILTASSNELNQGEIKIKSITAKPRPGVPGDESIFSITHNK